MRRSGSGPWFGIAVTALLVGSVVALGTFGRRAPPATDTVRTVRVSMDGPVERSARNQPLSALWLSGAQPTAVSTAVVETDENCAPDTNGVSNCTNRLRMSDGALMVIAHPHRMSEVPCLAPGETVKVVRV